MDTPILTTKWFRILIAIVVLSLPLVLFLSDRVTRAVESDNVERYLQTYLSSENRQPLDPPIATVQSDDRVVDTYQLAFAGQERIHYVAFGLTASCAGTRFAATDVTGKLMQAQWDYRYHEVNRPGLVWVFLPILRQMAPAPHFYIHIGYDPECAAISSPSVIRMENIDDWAHLLLLDYIFRDAEGNWHLANSQGYRGDLVPPEPALDWVQPKNLFSNAG